MVELLRTAMKAGHKAKYVLMDSWFANPRQIVDIRPLGCHGLSYDALTAHISIVFARYMLLAVAKRGNEDERTLGELFYLMVSEVADLSFRESMLLIVSAMIDAVEDMFRLTDTQVNGLLERFLGNLPEHLRRSLQPYLAA